MVTVSFILVKADQSIKSTDICKYPKQSAHTGQCLYCLPTQSSQFVEADSKDRDQTAWMPWTHLVIL